MQSAELQRKSTLQSPKSQGLNRLKAMGLISLICIGLALVFALGLLHHYNGQLPADLSGVAQWKPRSLSRVYSADGELIGEFYLQRRIPIPLDGVPEGVQRAFLAAEDGGFYEHPGLDFLGITRAALTNLLAGRVVQGGSTITQQVVKNLLLTPERSLSRKIKEALLSLRLERELTKDQILETYLNLIYLGHGAYGIEAAAQTYFGKSAHRLTVAEGAILAGLVQAPNRLSPLRDLAAAKKRQRYVLDQMVRNGFLPPEEAETAFETALAFLRMPGINDQAAPDFVEVVRREVQAQFGRALYTDGLTIHTTLNMALQRQTRRAIENGVEGIHSRQGFRGAIKSIPQSQWARALDAHWSDKRVKRRLGGFDGEIDDPPADQEIIQALVVKKENGAIHLQVGPHQAKLYPPSLDRLYSHYDRQERWVERTLFELLTPGDWVMARWIAQSEYGPVFDLQDVPSAQGAALVMDVQSGDVLAMVGGYDAQQSRFNRVLQSRRQPGSTFKPFVYAAALEAGFNQTTVIHDRPLSFPTAGGRRWRPHNYNHRYYGKITLRTALAKSLNSVAVQLLDAVGVEKVISLVRRLGIRAPLVPNLTLALGASEVSLMEMTTAYGTLARGGQAKKPRFIRQVLDQKGEILMQSPTLTSERALSKASAFVLADMMQEVTTRGTGRKAKVLGHHLGGKTGTTNQYRDAWFIGFSKDIAAGVWLGTDGHKPLGHDESGGKTALPVWIEIMEGALADKDKKPFPMPPGVLFVHADPERGTPPQKFRRSAHLAVHRDRVDEALLPHPPQVVAESP